MALNIGDRVKISEAWPNLEGETGTVWRICEWFGDTPYLIRLDKPKAFAHNGNGTVGENRGWWVGEEDVEVIGRAAQSGEEDKMSDRAGGEFYNLEQVKVDMRGFGFESDTVQGIIGERYCADNYIVYVFPEAGGMLKLILPIDRLRHIKREFKLIIESEGDVTRAKLLHGKEVVRKARVKRYSADIYDEEAAAKAAVAKLFEPESLA